MNGIEHPLGAGAGRRRRRRIELARCLTLAVRAEAEPVAADMIDHAIRLVGAEAKLPDGLLRERASGRTAPDDPRAGSATGR